MRVTIHQPEHLPWLGYFNKVLNADVFVILDDCQYEKNYFQNRNKIRTQRGLEYVTMPVTRHLDTPLNEVKLASNWRFGSYKDKIRQAYRKAPNYKVIWSLLEPAYTGQNLCEINLQIIKSILGYLGIERKLVYSHDLGITSKSSQRILDIVQALKAETYLSGPSGRDYLDLESFSRAGIRIIFNDFAHPVYKQLWEPFVPYASTLDVLMLFSPEEALRIIRSGFTCP